MLKYIRIMAVTKKSRFLPLIQRDCTVAVSVIMKEKTEVPF
jgi:hypothetical protein